MTIWTLIFRSLRFHARAHLGALLGAAVGSAVLIGALVVGDSVRGSLRDMALARLGKVQLELAANDRAPHKITTWVRELADRFHGFYHDCYVIGDVPPELTQARLWLVEAARIGLQIGLDLLGVSAPESM